MKRRFFDEPIDFEWQEGAGSPVWRARTPDASALQALAVAVHRAGGRLAALWGSDVRALGECPAEGGFCLHCVFGIEADHLWLTLELAAGAPAYHDLAGIFPAAGRMQRAVHDLLGLVCLGGDERPWLRHGGWPADWHPLRHDAGAIGGVVNEQSDYDFVRVGGEGAHEVRVGPIHAGIIEPGHFRFAVIGERVLRLETRLGYQHKGIERLLVGKTVEEGARLFARICCDATCAYAWAYAMALEAACGVTPPARALGLRALMLERERIANHLNDLGALGNDAGLAFGQVHFSRLKEDWLRMNGRLSGHRFMMDGIIPGGVACDPDAAALAELLEQGEHIGREVRALQKIYEDHAGLQERFQSTGAIDADLAQEFSLTGLTARTTGLALDLRAHHEGGAPPAPWAALEVRPVTDTTGDVAARVAVRFGEIYESLRLLRLLVAGLPGGECAVALPGVARASGLGIVEGWRGEVLCGVELDGAGRLARVHPHDPSWQNWLAVEQAAVHDIIADFPLINKSFNLSYSGVDL